MSYKHSELPEEDKRSMVIEYGLVLGLAAFAMIAAASELTTEFSTRCSDHRTAGLARTSTPEPLLNPRYPS